MTRVQASLRASDTLVCRFSVHVAIVDFSLSSPPPHAYSVDNISLFGLVAKCSGFLRARGSGGTDNTRVMSEFPSTHPE
jgi:hypothetical protein